MFSGPQHHSSAGPTLVASGAEAIKEAKSRLSRAVPATVLSSMGWIDLKPGTIWSGNQILICGDSAVVYYMVDDRLYQEKTATFVRGHYFETASKAARSAMPMVVLAQYEIAFLTSALVPWYFALGVSGAALGLFYKSNRALVDSAIENTRTVMQLMSEVKGHAPVLYDVLMGRVWQQVAEGLGKSALTAEDAVSLVASILATIVTSKSLGAAKPEMHIASKRILGLLGEIVRGLAIDTLSQIHVKAVQFASSSEAKVADALLKSLTRAGYRTTPGQQKAIEREMSKWPQGVETLQRLRSACDTLLATLNRLAAALERQGII